MDRNRILIISAVTAALIVAAIPITWVWGLKGLAVFGGLAGIGAPLWALARGAHPVIPELTVAIVYNTERQAFARLLWPGRHFVFPLIERITAFLSTEPDIVEGTTPGVQSADGVPLTVVWALAYEIAPEEIPEANRPALVRLLIRNSRGLALRQIEDCLRGVLGRFPAQGLYGAHSRNRLSRLLRDEAAARLLPFGFRVHRIMLQAMTPPEAFQRALVEAQQRHLQAAADAAALSTLRQAIHQFTEQEFKHLAELERLHVLGENGVTLLLPYNAVSLNGESAGHTAGSDNGKTLDTLRRLGEYTAP